MLTLNDKFDINKHNYNLKCNSFTSEQKFSDYVKNKKVAIIGPSPSVKNENNGNFIEENYDIIIRINKQWKHDKKLNKYIGRRTDILYNCLNPSNDCGGKLDIKYLKNKIKYIVCPIKYDFLNKNDRDKQFHNDSILHLYNNFHLKNKNRIKFIPIDTNLYNYYDNLAQTRINTGLLAIFHILNYDIKELYIKGFTFFLDGYLLDYRNVINKKICNNINDTKKNVHEYMNIRNNHNQEKQWNLFKQVYQEKKEIIKLDKKLESIIKLNEFPNKL